MYPSGEQYSIEGSGYSAIVTEVGATLRQLRHKDRDLVATFSETEIRQASQGAVLAPWPNRLADGAYTFDGRRHQVPLSEPTRGNALHGLVSWLPWSAIWHQPDRVELMCRLFPSDGYPFHLELSMSYSVTPFGLACRLEACNIGSSDAPYGAAAHPYLVAGPGPVDEWILDIPAEQYLEVTPDRLLPMGLRDVSDTDYDFRKPHVIGDTKLDTAFTDLTRSEVRVLADSGSGISLSWDAACSWVQVFTSDMPGSAMNRRALAVEPMTCPPDAFNSGTDLIILGPGDRHATNWTIGAI